MPIPVANADAHLMEPFQRVSVTSRAVLDAASTDCTLPASPQQAIHTNSWLSSLPLTRAGIEPACTHQKLFLVSGLVPQLSSTEVNGVEPHRNRVGRRRDHACLLLPSCITSSYFTTLRYLRVRVAGSLSGYTQLGLTSSSCLI